jgi:hypothetical protein
VCPTWNPSDKHADFTLSNGYWTATKNGTNDWRGLRATTGKNTGKWYWEVTLDNAGDTGQVMVDVCTATTPLTSYIPYFSTGWGYYAAGQAYWNHQGINAPASTTGDVIGVALDMDSGKIWWSINNVWINSGNPATGSNATFSNIPTDGTLIYPSASMRDNGNVATIDFDLASFVYTPPAGFLAMCDTEA